MTRYDAIIWQSHRNKGTWLTTCNILFSETSAVTNGPILIDGRNERCDPWSVISPGEILRLQRTATHPRRVDAQIVAKEVHFFVGGCADDADLL